MSRSFDVTAVPPWVKYVVLFSSGSVIMLYAERAYRRYVVRQVIRRRKERAKKAIEHLRTQLKEQQVDTKLSTDILSMTVMELHNALQSGKLKAVDVLLAYQRKAMQENDRLNFMTEPIHGAMGEDSTVGVASLIGEAASDDAVLVKVLKDQGAVPFVRTNVPQTMLSVDCSNPIYGKSLNPRDTNRTPGGSSGGEAASLAAGASILGIGSDIAGSIRIPSHFCGVTGLKPTQGRLSTKGMRSLTKPQNIVIGTGGPMARDVDGVVLLMRAMLSPLHFQLDPSIPPIPFQEKEFSDTRRLRIGYYTSHGYADPVPSCRRAVFVAKEALEKNGHTLVEFEPPRIPYAMSHLYMKVMNGDGGQTLADYLKDDVVDPSMKMVIFNSRQPLRVRHFLASLAGWLYKKYREEFYDAWTRLRLDIVICPAFGFVAPPYGNLDKSFGGGLFAPTYNLVNYPAGCLPVTSVSTADIDDLKTYPQNTMFEKTMKKVSEGSEGLPVGVQVVGQKWQEELVLRVMKEIERNVLNTVSKQHA
ncbi:vitamin D3 hydroxylase-associated protein-like [Ylistrum balloti]|uniref:vitamin D3 hydroxylase-associated protein-like n=1 Tax=Ylistrum balloti TaxID=509963 RepID=UPI0029058617|nr:vitamin D3 hydroxylase-associated protein-like [Ylistrum balloti]